MNRQQLIPFPALSTNKQLNLFKLTHSTHTGQVVSQLLKNTITLS